MNPNTPFVRKLEKQLDPTLVPADPPVLRVTNPSRVLLPMSALEALTALHYGEGAAVAFARTNGGKWQECGAILTCDLAAKWPTVERYLRQDSFFSLASTYEQKQATGVSPLGLPRWSRKADRLRWLNAVVVDCDQHQAQRFSSEAFLEVFWHELELQDIPCPTFLQFSGRGLWPLWQLRDFANQYQPVPAFPDKRAIVERLNRALVQKFASLGADPNSTDAARVMRIAGSVNSKWNTCVRFYRATEATYSLPELADALGVPARKVTLPGERRGPKDAVKQKAAMLRWSYPLAGFRDLWKKRKVFTEGTRRPAIFVFAILLKKNRATPEEVLSSCSRLAESLVPPITAAEVRRQIAASRKAQRYNFSNRKFAEMLKITPTEQAALPRWFRTKKKKHKAVQIADRRATIARELASQPLSGKQLSAMLRERHGIFVSQRTVERDLRHLPATFSVLIDSKLSLLHKQKKCRTLSNAAVIQQRTALAAQLSTRKMGESMSARKLRNLSFFVLG